MVAPGDGPKGSLIVMVNGIWENWPEGGSGGWFGASGSSLLEAKGTDEEFERKHACTHVYLYTHA